MIHSVARLMSLYYYNNTAGRMDSSPSCVKDENLQSPVSGWCRESTN